MLGSEVRLRYRRATRPILIALDQKTIKIVQLGYLRIRLDQPQPPQPDNPCLASRDTSALAAHTVELPHRLVVKTKTEPSVIDVI
jgi:hypothetical protein